MTTRIEFTYCPLYIERPEEGVDFNGNLIEVGILEKDQTTMEFASTLLAAHLHEDDERARGATDVMSNLINVFGNKNIAVYFNRPYDPFEKMNNSVSEGDDIFGGVSYHYTPLKLQLDSNFPDQVMDSYFEVLEDFGEEDYLLVEARVYVDYAPHGGDAYESYEFIIPVDCRYDYEYSF